MTSLKMANRRVGSLFAVAALVLATVTPGLVPAFASAAQVTERSVELSSSSAGTEGASYLVKFKAVQSAGAVVLDFCANTPLIDSPCTAPTGFNVASATTTTSGFTVAPTTAGGNHTVALTGTVAAGASVELRLNGVDNPTAAGPLYVRIVSYDNETNALAYESENLKTGVRDQGSAAISITNTVGVSGAVMESMTFCVAGEAIASENCAGASGLKAPTLKLGEVVADDVVALNPTALSTGSIFTQISTNAVSGAVVSLKSGATACGGLVRAGAPTSCDIAPALNTGITAGQAKFGVRGAVATNVGAGTNSNGTFQTVPTSIYGTSAFALNYVTGDATGITSPFGDPFLDTAGAPVNNKNMEITFGASVSNNTPAGLYSTDLSLIATGKF